MRPGTKHSGVAGAWAVLLTLLMVAGTAGAADDVGLVDAARNQDSSKVRALIDRKADVNARVGRRIHGAALGCALERRREC